MTPLAITTSAATGSQVSYLNTWEALVNAASVPNEINPDLFAALDWDRFVEAAEYHGVLPIVAQRVLESSAVEHIGPVTQDRLRRSFQASLMKSLPLVQEIHEITQAFGKENVPIIPYKGPALAEQYWGSFSLRHCVDLDFFVRAEDAEKAGKILEGRGYVRVSPVARHLHAALVRNASEEQYQHRETKLLLELQWAPAPRVFALDFDSEKLWTRTRKYEFAGEMVTVPSVEDLLLLLCIHGWKHNWSRLIWVGDVAQLLRQEQFNWDVLLVSARKDGTLGILSLGLQMAHRIFDVPLPPVCLVVGASITELADELIIRMQHRQPCKYLEWHRFMLAARENRIARLRQILKFLWTPALGEYAAVKLPPGLKSVYPLIRLARVLRLMPGKTQE